MRNVDPITNSPSQILLEALQNFVIPLIHAADGENKKDISQVHLGLEAGKLLTALQEFISSMIIQSRVGQPQEIEVDLEDDTQAESPGAVAGSTVTDPGPSEGIDFPLEEMYQTVMGRLPEAVREHVFSKMPIRVLHFTDTSRDSGTRLQITLLERNSVCSRVIENIQAKYSERMFRERVEFYRSRAVSPSERPFIPYLTESDTPWVLSKDQKSIENYISKELVWEYTKYAILSHTWLRGLDMEVTYGAWQIGQFDTQQPGYQKLANFCTSAWKDHQLCFGWMDTICINKDSSSELDESIRSMYKWYESSYVCITYLAETVALGYIHRDPWFTRGWTFQELLAPARMVFYNKDWQKFIPYNHSGDKYNPDIVDQLSKATTITKFELWEPISQMPISRKMQLAAGRHVTREEDTAYSLMGVCNVSISIAYGEGAQRAFFRLMTEILNTSGKVVDIFNCAQAKGSSIIPSAPSVYLHCSSDIGEMRHKPPLEPLLLTHVGLRMPILLMPSLPEGDLCLENDSIGHYYAMAHLPALDPWKVGSYHLLDKGVMMNLSYSRWTFGILNFGGDTTRISVPHHCLAVCFEHWDNAEVPWDSDLSPKKRIATKKPIVFQLKTSTSGYYDNYYVLQRSSLEKHGMTLTTMYL